MEPERLICLGCGELIDEDADCPRCAAAEQTAAEQTAGQAAVAEPPARASGPPQGTGSEVPALRCAACGGHVEPGATRCRFCRATVSTTRCGACLGWNLASAKHCGWCGVAVEGRQAGPSTLACPRCGDETMRAVRYRDLEADECPRCDGLFLGPAVLDRLVGQRDHAARLHLALPQRERHVEREVRYLACPICRAPMNRKQFGRMSGVIVDTCKHHGVWFDGGELQAVLDFVSRGGLERARQRDLDDLKDERRTLESKKLELSAESARLEARAAGRSLTRGGGIAAWIVDAWLR
jgi:Zn-finger nucleic acid-binding protein